LSLRCQRGQRRCPEPDYLERALRLPYFSPTHIVAKAPIMHPISL
jgi:hypothetical protein